jgi:hypothetical protein
LFEIILKLKGISGTIGVHFYFLWIVFSITRIKWCHIFHHVLLMQQLSWGLPEGIMGWRQPSSMLVCFVFYGCLRKKICDIYLYKCQWISSSVIAFIHFWFLK